MLSNGEIRVVEDSLNLKIPILTKLKCTHTNICAENVTQETNTPSHISQQTLDNKSQSQGNSQSLHRYLIPSSVFPRSFQEISTPGFSIDISLNINNSNYEVTNGSIVGIGNNTDGFIEYGDYVYDYSSADESLPLQEILPVSFVYAITLLVGVVGNLLVIIAVARDRRLMSITNIFLTSLACADLALLCFCVPVKCVAFFSFSWTFGFFLCKSVHYFQIVAMVCSVMTLTMMSIERNIAILSPLKSKRICTRSRAKIVVVLLWTASVVLALPILAGQLIVSVMVTHIVLPSLLLKQSKEFPSPYDTWEIQGVYCSTRSPIPDGIICFNDSISSVSGGPCENRYLRCENNSWRRAMCVGGIVDKQTGKCVHSNRECPDPGVTVRTFTSRSRRQASSTNSCDRSYDCPNNNSANPNRFYIHPDWRNSACDSYIVCTGGRLLVGSCIIDGYNYYNPARLSCEEYPSRTNICVHRLNTAIGS